MQWISKLRKKSVANTPYQRIGGEESVTAIANTFYDIMESDSYVKALYDIHPKPLDSIRQTFASYLMMWMGGPDTYTPQKGHPRLRARHLPFQITKSLKEEWMYCMRKTMTMHIKDAQERKALLEALDQLAEHMINTP